MKISIRPVSTIQLPKRVALSASSRGKVGAYALALMNGRLDKGIGLNDAKMKAYSPRGPVYMPVYGTGKMDVRREGTMVRLSRSKKNLQGRFGFSSKDIRAMHDRGTARVTNWRGRQVRPGPYGQNAAEAKRTRSKKSLRFANYSAMKKALGRSGERDLMLTGQMRAAIGITRNTTREVEIGFTREEVRGRALGNQERTPWFGLSPKDARTLTVYVTRLLDEALQNSRK